MKKWRVGSLSAGLLLILLGGLLLADTVGDVDVLSWIVAGWPVILILLGIEVLVFQFLKEEEKVRYDGVSILILILVVLVSLILIPVHSFGLADSFSPADSVSVSERFGLPDDVKEIRVEVPHSDVRLKGGDGKDLRVDGTLAVPAGKGAGDRLDWTVEGERAVLRVKQPRNPVRWFFNQGHSRMTVELPRSLSLDVDAQAGDVEIEGMEKATEVRHASGDLTLLRMDGDVSLRHQHGDIRMKDMRSRVEAENANGDIRCAGASGPLDLRTSNGDIRLESGDVKDDWRAVTSRGDVILTLTGSPDATVEGETSLGERTGSADWKDGRVVLGSGKNQIRLATSTGDIRVDAPK